MTTEEKQRAKDEYYRKKQSGSGQPAGGKKEFGQQRPTNKDGRPLTDEQIQRRKDEFFKKQQEKGKFQSRDN